MRIKRGFFYQLRDRKVRAAYIFLIPILAWFIIFIFAPMFYAFYLSFLDWNILSPATEFVGLDNYKAVFRDKVFWKSLRNTAYFAVGSVPIGIVVSLCLALMLNRKLALRAAYRTAYFIPVVTSMVAVSIVWKWLYQPTFGLFNFILERLGLPSQGFLTSPKQAMPSIILMSIWKGVGFNMVIFLAGLQAIPRMYYEAARIDGASNWKLFTSITLPLLKPTTLFITVISMIGSLQVFTQVYVMTTGLPTGLGGPNYATRTVIMHIQELAFKFLKMSYGSAMAWILFIIIMFFTLVQMRFLRSGTEY